MCVSSKPYFSPHTHTHSPAYSTLDDVERVVEAESYHGGARVIILFGDYQALPWPLLWYWADGRTIFFVKAPQARSIGLKLLDIEHKENFVMNVINLILIIMSISNPYYITIN